MNIARFLIASSLMAYSVWASAFYYEEHKLVTQEALNIVTKSGDLKIDQEKIKRGIGGDALCRDLMNATPGACFTLADLPALSGDHAGSPMLIQWKWLDGDGSGKSHSFIIDALALAKVFFEGACTSSETTISKVPNRKSFAKAVHENPDATEFATDYSLSDADSNYVRSAGHNCNHFRVNSIGEQSAASLESRTFNIFDKPAFFPHFLAKYVKAAQRNVRNRERPALTATALELASYDTDIHIAAAWIFESFALHFIQDGVSAGHIDTPADGGGSVIFVTKKIHDKQSNNGINVSIESACKKLNNLSPDIESNFLALANACKNRQHQGKLFGDKNMISDSTGLTKDLAVFLSFISLQEFGEAMASRAPLLQDQVPEPGFKNDPFWTYDSVENQDLAKKLFSWWESAGRSTQSSAMKRAAEKYFKKDKLEALSLWPVPREADTSSPE
jgi:hypothetical protein